MENLVFFFRIDLDSKSGLGHYARVNSFINFTGLKRYKIVVDKLPKTDFFLEKRNFLELYKDKKKFISEKFDVDKFLEITKCNQKNAIVFKDSYRLGYEWERKISKKCKKLISIEDFNDKKHYVDFYISYNSSFSTISNEKLNLLKKNNKKNCKFLLGKDYSLFDTRIDKKINLSSDIVFYNGGSGDPLIYEKVINELIKSSKKKLKIIIVVGPLVTNSNYKKILKKYFRYRGIKIIYKPSGILNILKGTKLFVSSAGVSMLESSFLNIPTLLFKMISNQNTDIENYEKLGHYFVLDKKHIKDSSKIVTLIKFMISDIKRIKKLTKKNSLNIVTIKKNYRQLLHL